MKKLLLSPIVLFALASAHCHHPLLAAAEAGPAGKWQLTFNTPHGVMNGTLDIKQAGNKLSGTCASDHFGSVPLAGSVDGKKISIDIEVQGMAFKMIGTLDADKMSGTIEPDFGTWSATRDSSSAVRFVLGSIDGIKPDTLEFAVKPDSGALTRFRAGAETDVIQVPPGERDLEHGKAIRVSDVNRGDRVLVSFVAGMPEARRIVLVSSDDIVKRNETERLDWQKRGVSGTVLSNNGEEVVVETRTSQGAQKTVVVVPAKAKIRQYAPDSVSFAAAVPATVLAIAPGDQFTARGNKTPDGARLTAEEVIFGTFLTKMGTIVAIDSDARRVRIEDLVTKAPLTVKLMPASQLKTMAAPKTAAAPSHGGPAPDPGSVSDIAQLLRHMPAAKIEDLKVGSAIILTATKSSHPDEVTAIMLLANIDGFLQFARTQAANQGISLTEAMAGMHGGLMRGANGLSLPAILP